MKKRLLIVLMTLILVMGAFATAAWAGSKLLGRATGTYNVVSSLNCTPNKVYLRSYTGGFGFMDSTGSLVMRYRDFDTGQWVSKTFTGEFDEVSKTWYAPSKRVGDVTFAYSGLSIAGYAYAYWACWS